MNSGREKESNLNQFPKTELNPEKKEWLEKILELEVAYLSVPKERESAGEQPNQDAVLELPNQKIFGVFDGMGGHTGGKIAAEIARDCLIEFYRQTKPADSLDEMKDRLLEALKEVNQKILKKSKLDEQLTKMGATASVLQVYQKGGDYQAIVGQVGDSRVYIMRNSGELEQVTVDDNPFIDEVLRNEGEQKAREFSRRLDGAVCQEDLTGEESYIFMNRNVISQSLGRDYVSPKIYVADLKPGNRCLITSDGIHDNLSYGEIKDILGAKENSQHTTEKLIEQAGLRSREDHLRSKRDDMSAVVIDIKSFDS